jgi:hypothetical protein
MTPEESDRALLLVTYQIERAADSALVQGIIGLVSLALVYMGATAALLSGGSEMPLGFLALLLFPWVM